MSTKNKNTHRRYEDGLERKANKAYKLELRQKIENSESKFSKNIRFINIDDDDDLDEYDEYSDEE